MMISLVTQWCVFITVYMLKKTITAARMSKVFCLSIIRFTGKTELKYLTKPAGRYSHTSSHSRFYLVLLFPTLFRRVLNRICLTGPWVSCFSNASQLLKPENVNFFEEEGAWVELIWEEQEATSRAEWETHAYQAVYFQIYLCLYYKMSMSACSWKTEINNWILNVALVISEFLSRAKY